MAVIPAAPRHGGALLAAARRYSIPPSEWLDLSTGVNPVRYPFAATITESFQRLPDPEALAWLLATARSYYRVPASASIIAAPGSDIALRLLPLAVGPGDVDLLEPGYSGHGESWRAGGRLVRPLSDPEWADAKIVVMAQPNNPDGRVFPREPLLALADRLTSRGGVLVVDEAFADLTPEMSLVPAMGERRIVVLRSFGKFFGLAGVRLGFVIGEPEIVEMLGAWFGDWPVSGTAIAVGQAALADRDWQDATRRRLVADAAALASLLRRHDFLTIGGTDLFQLVDHADAGALHEFLALRGIWTRIFADLPGWIRFGTPRAEDLPRLEAALAAWRRR